MEILRFLHLPELVRGIISALLSFIILFVPNSTYTTVEDTSKHMLTGDEIFSYNGEKWTVGFAREVLTPDDITEETYYIAGYNTNNPAKSVLDDMYAKAVYLDDNSGRGGVVICAIDCMGISRKDINDIRKIVIESGKIPNLKSINICATHTHSAIDTQGLWGKNFLSDGKNEEFMNELKERTANSIISAYINRKDGNLYFGTAESEGLLTDTREPIDYDETVTSIRFDPADGSNDTYIVNFTCHAEMLGSKTTFVSADFPAYMDKEINERTGGANVVFLNGAVGGLITGAEIDTFLRADTEFTIEHTKQFGKNVANLVLSINNEVALAPAINVKTEAIEIKCDNTALLLVRFLEVLNNDVAKDKDRNISIISEVSYMELGNNQIGIYMIPGELSPELESGNFMSAEESANGTEADYKPLSEMARCEHNFVLGLCNDELGYIIPENDFFLHEWLPYFNNAVDLSGRKHYEETNSLGPQAAGAILEAMDELISSTKR
ncbi:MAG: hypothetical protein IJO03_11980 [Clostridia bacterium]|nr:hypothetical protein [Clostridia bacterium]MBQ7122970.1 hypothetical protein [Clostridia bacterium]